MGRRASFSGNEGETRFGYAQGIETGGLITVSGQVGRDNPTGLLDSLPTLSARCERALHNVRHVVRDLGGDDAELVSLQLHVAVPLDAAHRVELGKVLAAFAGDERPAVTVVPVTTLFSTDYLVEVSAMATTLPRIRVADDGPLGRDLSRSRAVRVGDQVFLGGHLPLDDGGAVLGEGLIAQFEQVCAGLAATLAEAGGTIADIVATHVWIAGAPTDEEAAALSPAHAAVFGASQPAATLLFVPELPYGARVQISAVAMVDGAPTTR